MPYLLPTIESWSDWSATFNDVDLWRPVIDAICDSEGIRYRSIQIPRSNTNAVFILDSQLVVKIYSPFWSEFDMEATLIEVLGANRTIPVPEIVAAGRYHDRVSWNYLIMEYLDGLTPRCRQAGHRAERPAVHRDRGGPNDPQPSRDSDQSPWRCGYRRVLGRHGRS